MKNFQKKKKENQRNEKIEKYKTCLLCQLSNFFLKKPENITQFFQKTEK